MESPPLARHVPRKSKKRVFTGSNSSCMDAELMEIPASIPRPSRDRGSNSKSLKQKEVIHPEIIHPEIIDVDMDEDCVDKMVIDGKVDSRGKGKEHLPNLLAWPGSGVQEPDDGMEFKVIDIDGFGSDLFDEDDAFVDMCSNDLIYEDYSILQSYFDNMDIPTGVEAPIPWFPPGPLANKMTSGAPSASDHACSPIQSDAVGSSRKLDTSGSSVPPVQSKVSEKSISDGSLKLGAQIEAVLESRRSKAPTWSVGGLTQDKKKPDISSGLSFFSSHKPGGSVNLSAGWKSVKSFSLHNSPQFKRKSQDSYPTSLHNSNNQFPYGGSSFAKSGKTTGYKSNLTPNIGLSIPEWEVSAFTSSYPQGMSYQSVAISGGNTTFSPWFDEPVQSLNNVTVEGSSEIPTSSGGHPVNAGEILEKFRLFKKFDTVQDYSDHHYSRNGSSMKQPSKPWAKRVQEEWKILEKDLPDTIYVRVYESRLDILRAAIIGAEGTPYHDGLFFFDVFFPSSYPNVPPQVHYHSGGLRINPNLYNCGKVCLSLLNTWSGGQEEKWIPGVSTMLQVLVSIQGLILNAKPFFNEPGYASMSGSLNGERSSSEYNENTFLLSLKTMVYNIRRPPKHFEDFVAGHFIQHAHDILVACRAYMDGAQVGCLVKGGVQDVDEGDRSCSQKFKDSLAGFITSLVNAFVEVGARDCDRFLYLAEKGNKLASASPSSINYFH